jgi:osmotically-inducible protein OsmY
MSNYYSGYYWGLNPYDSSDLEGRVSDIELRNEMIARIRTMDKARTMNMTILVKDAIVTLRGTVMTFQERQILGEEIWKIPGVFIILNLLKVADPMIAGPILVKSDNSAVQLTE